MISMLRCAVAPGLFLLLGACATGQDSLVAIHPARGALEPRASTSSDPRTALALDQAAPNLLAASGTALLPGARVAALGGAVATPAAVGGELRPGSAASVALAGPLGVGAPAAATVAVAGGASLSPGVSVSAGAAPLVSASTNGAATTVAVAAPVTGPLIAVTGSGSGLLGATELSARLGSAPAATASLNVGGGADVASAPSRIVATATAAASRPLPTGAPMSPPNVGGLPVAAGLLAVTKGLPIPGRL